jgi:predicted DNA-binding transcriptional regulator AlpA
MSSLCQRTPAPRSVPDISEFLRISSRDLAPGKFPKRLHLGPGTVAWLASELEDYFASLAATRD